MNRASLVSVVIPAYNAAAFIERTVDSIKRQSYRRWELIVVDDGSADDTARIIDSISAADSRIHAIHQENGGEVAARRTGVLHAAGEWVMFVDADDCLPVRAIESLCQHCHCGDVVVGTMHVVNMRDDGSVAEDYVWHNMLTGEMSGVEFAKGVFVGKVQMSACAKIYRKRIFDGFEWCVDRQIRQNPDLLMNIGIGMCVSKVFVTNEAVCYDYIIHSGSASTMAVMPAGGWFRLFDMAEKYISVAGLMEEMRESFFHYRLSRFDAMMRHGVLDFTSADIHVRSVLEEASCHELDSDERKVVMLLRSGVLRKIFYEWQKMKGNG